MTKKEINLHSIMYLLIRKIAEHTGFSVSGFTFHNVSINSNVRFDITSHTL